MDIDVRRIEAEIETWREYLNSTVGILTFTIALACLSLPSPQIYAFGSLLFLCLVGFSNASRFPPTLRALRDKDRSAEEDIVYRGIQSRYFGFWSAIKTVPIFIGSWVFLGFVAVGLIQP